MSALQPENLLNEAPIFVAHPLPVEDNSLLSLSPTELTQITEEIKQVKFTPYIEEWIRAYEKVGQRGRFLWQWCLKGLSITTLPSVQTELREHVIETKLISILYGTLIDDIADRDQDREMFQMAVSLASDRK